MAAEPGAAPHEVEVVPDGRAPRLGALVEELTQGLRLHVGQAREWVGARDVRQQRAGQAAGRDDGVAVREVRAGQHGVGVADGVGVALGEAAEVGGARVAELDVHGAEALVDEDRGERVVVVGAAAGAGEVRVGRDHLPVERVVDRSARRRGAAADGLEEARALDAREVRPHIRAGGGEPEGLRAYLRRVDGLQGVDDAQQRGRGVGRGLQRVWGAGRTAEHPARVAEVGLREIARRDLFADHPLDARAHLGRREGLPRRRDRHALGLEALKLKPAAALLPHRVGAEREPVLEQREREIGLAAHLPPAAHRELRGFLPAVEHRPLRVQVEGAAGAARPVQDRVRPAAHVGAVHVEAVVGEDAAALHHVGQVIAGDDGLGEAADRGAHVPRLREPAAGVGTLVVGAHRELQHIGDVLGRDVVEEVLGQDGDRGGRVEEGRVHPRAGEGVGGAVALVALGGDDEGGELHGGAGGGRGFRGGQGGREEGQDGNGREPPGEGAEEGHRGGVGRGARPQGGANGARAGAATGMCVRRGRLQPAVPAVAPGHSRADSAADRAIRGPPADRSSLRR